MRPRAVLSVLAVLAGCGAPDGSALPGGPPTARPDPVAPAWGPWIRRLSAREIVHALEDLTGIADPTSVGFPVDPADGRFDDLAENAAISSLLVERLDLAADLAASGFARQRLGGRGLDPGPDFVAGCTWADPVDGLPWTTSWTSDPVDHPFTVDRPGRYRLELATRWRGPGTGAVEVTFDGEPVGAWTSAEAAPFEVVALAPRPVVEVELTAGAHVLTWSNESPYDLALLDSPDPAPCGFAAAWQVRARIVGPLPAGCADGAACAGDEVTTFARRAWRRPLADGEATRLRALVGAGVDAGAALDEALEGAIHAVLLSPSFLIVSDSLAPDGRLDASSLAARLALLAWGSVPDDALAACADSGALLADDGPCAVEAQLDRMLADPRGTRFAEGFVPQWLALAPGPSALPADSVVDFPLVYEQMRAEAVALVQAALDDPTRRLEDLVDAPVGHVEPELAAWYGATTGPDGAVDLAALGRSGVVGLGAVHATTANAGVPSLVRRGVWVRDVLLCDPPSPPPAGVPRPDVSGLSEEDALAVLDPHLHDPACASCHAGIDPLGTALLAYDGFGRLRSPTHAPEALPDGTELADPADLQAWLRRDDRFTRCLTAAVSSYAIGREVRVGRDDARIDAWLDAARRRGGSLSDLLAAIVRSDAFRRREP